MSVFKQYLEMLGGEDNFDAPQNLIVFIRCEPEFFHKAINMCKKHFRNHRKSGVETRDAIWAAINDFGDEFGHRELNRRNRHLFDRLMEMPNSLRDHCWNHGLLERKMKPEEYL